MSEMTYRQAGDYRIPNIRLENEETRPLGKYGRMRRAFLEQNNPMLLNDMILTETLFPHLWEIEETAKARVELLMNQYLKNNPAPGLKVEVSADIAPDGSKRLCVADNGRGIAPDALPYIFNRFYRADTTGKVKGTGLGLAIVKHAVEAHGGRITAESEPGVRTAFTITLPPENS